CAIFPTAASRRSLGRVSVPVWPVALSGRLPVTALVGHHPTNKLIGREPIPSQKPFPHPTMQQNMNIRYYTQFPKLIPKPRAGYSRVTHPFATNHHPKEQWPVRLACVKHAASVRPEPGSNSPTTTIESTHQPGRKPQQKQPTHNRQAQQTNKQTL